MTNSHITEYLDYYCSLNIDPQYAVLINGKWGSGKTWFIKQFIDRLNKQGKKYLYVSLYGISDFKGIESEFFSQLHPVLSHKGMEIASKLAKSVIKATIKYDMDNDGRDDGSIDLSLQNMPSYLINTNDHILIFDDVERCSIPISDLLGYVNNFVEHKSYKAILIANEKEIGEARKSATDSEKYSRVKEKLIGKSFNIKPNFDGAVASFLEEIKTGPALNALQKNLILVKNIFEKAEFENFRHIRQSFLEIDRIFSAFPVEAFSNNEFVEHFIKIYLIYSLETRSGTHAAHDVLYMRPNPKYLFERKPENMGVYEKLSKKYGLDFHDTLFTSDLWSELISVGNLNKVVIADAINNCQYFSKNTQEDWIILWNCGLLNDDQIDRYLKQVKQKFFNKQYDDVGVVFHVAGLLLWFAKIGVVDKWPSSIIKETTSYVNYLFKTNRLPINLSDLLSNNTYRSYGFYESDDPEFLRVLSFAKEKSLQVKLRSLPSKAGELLELMKSNPDAFCQKMRSSEWGYDFYRSSILNHIDKVKFVDQLSSLTNDKRATVRDCLNSRYGQFQDRSKLFEERAWIEGLIPVLERKAKKIPKTLTAYFFIKLRKDLLDILDDWVVN